MIWFRQNKLLGSFLVGLLVATVLAGYFLLHEKGAADDEQTRFESTASELNRLRSGKPFPDVGNLEKTKAQVQGYRDSLGAIEQELKARSLPAVPLQPNEFQAQLRQAVNSVLENARTNKVKLPDHFYLGFDEYATSLPNPTAAPLLGQELQAIAMVADVVVNAHVDALTSLTRTALPEENPAASPTPTPAKGRGHGLTTKGSVGAAPVISSHAFEIGFSASPTAARKVLNGITTAKEQLFIIRTLNVKNQVDKGPARGGAAGANLPPPVPQPAGSPGGKSAPAAISFIVGTEHLDAKAKIEIINLLPEKETR